MIASRLAQALLVLDSRTLQRAIECVAVLKLSKRQEYPMNIPNTMLRAAMTSVLALSATSFTASAIAANEHANDEQCAGLVKAGKNECATANNGCRGHVEKDKDPMAWIYVPKGTCERIVGARVVVVTDPSITNK